MKYLYVILLSLVAISLNAQDKKVVVVTVDDLPVVYYAKADLLHYKTVTNHLNPSNTLLIVIK